MRVNGLTARLRASGARRGIVRNGTIRSRTGCVKCDNLNSYDKDMPPKLTPEIIHAAILGYEEQKRHIDLEISELRAMLAGHTTETASAEAPTHQRRKMSAAGRKAIAEAQRKRWAALKKTSAPEAAPKPKRKLSAAGRKAIIAATKKRWALKKAEDAKQTTE
jgi:hypothetical protein